MRIRYRASHRVLALMEQLLGAEGRAIATPIKLPHLPLDGLELYRWKERAIRAMREVVMLHHVDGPEYVGAWMHIDNRGHLACLASDFDKLRAIATELYPDHVEQIMEGAHTHVD